MNSEVQTAAIGQRLG